MTRQNLRRALISLSGAVASLAILLALHGALLAGASVQPAAAAAMVPAAAPAVVSLWGGARESIALKSDGTVWTWGINSCAPLGAGACGKLGDGTQISRSIPVKVHAPGNAGFLTSITAIMGGEHANYALRSDGTVWAWGGNFVGQLGNGNYTNTVAPVQVSGLVSVTRLGGRGYHNLAVEADGSVWAWGWNKFGELGHDTSASPCPFALFGTCSNVPLQVLGITNPLTVTGGGFFSLALMPDHTLMGWGENTSGELADGSTVNRPAPVQVNGVLSNVLNVSAGWKHAVALTADHTAWTWGENGSGEIGNGISSTTGITVPFQVPGLGIVAGVSAGDGFTAILKSDGSVWTWGYNGFGQLGDGTYISRPSPVQVQGLSHVVSMAARDYHVLVIKDDGTVWAWGSGTYGELGNNAFADSTHPVQVLFLDKLLMLPELMR